jgi:hypothetical protein
VLQYTEAPLRRESSHYLEPHSTLSRDPQTIAPLSAPSPETADRAVEEEKGGEVQVLRDGLTDGQGVPSESKIKEKSWNRNEMES